MMRIEMLGDDTIVATLHQMTPALHNELHTSIGQLVLRMQTIVRAGKLTGQVLKVRTGRLRRNMDAEVRTSGHTVQGRVFTNVEYAPIHEYGYQGAVGVRGHLRQMKTAFGKRLKQPRAVFVRPHARQVNLPARSFLRSTLREMRGEITQQLEEAVQRGLRP